MDTPRNSAARPAVADSNEYPARSKIARDSHRAPRRNNRAAPGASKLPKHPRAPSPRHQDKIPPSSDSPEYPRRSCPPESEIQFQISVQLPRFEVQAHTASPCPQPSPVLSYFMVLITYS